MGIKYNKVYVVCPISKCLTVLLTTSDQSFIMINGNEIFYLLLISSNKEKEISKDLLFLAQSLELVFPNQSPFNKAEEEVC